MINVHLFHVKKYNFGSKSYRKMPTW